MGHLPCSIPNATVSWWLYNSVVYLGAAFPGTQEVLGCAVALELTWGPCSLPHCTSEAVKVCQSS